MTPKLVELPPRSGRSAFYDDAEQKLMRSLLDAGAKLPELTVLHDLKVEFGVHLVEDAE